MPDRLPPDRLERLCRALEFEPEGQRSVWKDDEIIGFESIWPALDTDDTWARKAMEAAVELGAWPVRVSVAKRTGTLDRWCATMAGFTEFAKTFPLALCRALDAALEAGELGP